MRPTKHTDIQGERQRELSFKECTGSDLEDKRHALYCLSDASRILRRKIRWPGSPQRWHRDPINDWTFSKVKKNVRHVRLRRSSCVETRISLRRDVASASASWCGRYHLFRTSTRTVIVFLLEDYIWDDRKDPTTVNAERRSIVAIIERSVSI